MANESNPALPSPRTPSRAMRLSVSLPPDHRSRVHDATPAQAGSQASKGLQQKLQQNGFHLGSRPMMRAALRVLQATRRIWREPLA
jgi:hypothetical protein